MYEVESGKYDLFKRNTDWSPLSKPELVSLGPAQAGVTILAIKLKEARTTEGQALLLT